MFAIYIRIPSRQLQRTPGVFYIPLPGVPSTEAPAEQRAGQEHRESGAGEPFLCSSSVRSEGNEYRTGTETGGMDPIQAEVQLWDEYPRKNTKKPGKMGFTSHNVHYSFFMYGTEQLKKGIIMRFFVIHTRSYDKKPEKGMNFTKIRGNELCFTGTKNRAKARKNEHRESTPGADQEPRLYISKISGAIGSYIPQAPRHRASPLQCGFFVCIGYIQSLYPGKAGIYNDRRQSKTRIIPF